MYTAAEILPLWKAKLPDLPDELHQELAEALAEFSVEVAKLEREACAKVCDEYAQRLVEARSNHERVIAVSCAAEMIREKN